MGNQVLRKVGKEKEERWSEEIKGSSKLVNNLRNDLLSLLLGAFSGHDVK